MSEAPITAADLIVGCVVENAPKFHAEVRRLVRSIRWFGGDLAKARLLVCAVEAIGLPLRKELEAFGAEVRVVCRFHERNGSANRLRFFEEVADDDRAILLLDCDTLVVRDPLPLLAPGRLQARIEALPTVTHEVFERLFRHYGMPLPPQSHLIGWTRAPTIPYFNTGVIFLPADLARELVPVWGRFNRELADRPELAYPCEKHLHQASFSLALAACPVPYEEAPVALHYPLNTTHLEPPEGFLACHPAVLHYHDRVDAEGFLLPPAYPLARLHVERFNRRLREEGKPRRAGAALPARSGKPPRVAVLGMHGAGGAELARLLSLAGLSGLSGLSGLAAGEEERREVEILDDALLAALGATWCEVGELDLGNLREPGTFAARARELTESFDARGPWILEDPRLCLVFPFWRELLGSSVCVLVHRDPLAVARALEERDALPLPLGLALWELHARAALAGSLGLPRVLISWHELIAAPGAVLRRLLAELAGFGIEGLRVPEEAEVKAVAAVAGIADAPPPDSAARQSQLTPPQLELLVAFESGAALALDPVPPLSAGARGTLSAYRSDREERQRLRREIDYRDGVIAGMEVRRALERREAEQEQARGGAKVKALDELLEAVFASRSWRTGHAVSRLFRSVTGSESPTAFERWKGLG